MRLYSSAVLESAAGLNRRPECDRVYVQRDSGLVSRSQDIPLLLVVIDCLANGNCIHEYFGAIAVPPYRLRTRKMGTVSSFSGYGRVKIPVWPMLDFPSHVTLGLGVTIMSSQVPKTTAEKEY